MSAIAGYEIHGELGRGGMGIIYRAFDPRLRREVAIKTLLAVDASPSQLRRFELEARALAQVRHPNVVAVHDVGRDAEGRPFLVMDLVEGTSLRARLDAAGPLPPRRAAELALAVARGLAAAHARSILHRDVKPENVIVTGDGTPLLTDFGLAKDLASENSGKITITGRFVGTPGYWSPEQAIGDPDLLGPATDVYGIGATLHAMLTGEDPFVGEKLSELILAALRRPPTPPSERNAAVPPALDEIVLRCLEKDPAERYANAGDLADALERFLRGAPIELLSTTRLRAVRLGGSERRTGARPDRSSRALDAAVGALVGAAVASLVAYAVASRRIAAIERAVAERPAAGAPPSPGEDARAERTEPAPPPDAPPEPAPEPPPEPAPAPAPEPARQQPEGEAAVALREAEAHIHAQSYLAAGEAAARAIALGERSSLAWQIRGVARLQLGDLEGALSDFDRAIELDPRSADAWSNRGTARRSIGDLDGSLADLTRAIELAPTRPGNFINRGLVHQSRQDMARAIADFTRAVELEPANWRNWSHKAKAHGQARELDAALAGYTRVIELAPTEATGWINRGSTRYDQGDREGAIADWSRGVELAPDAPIAARVRVWIEGARAGR